ncbi:MAG: helix-turn-helix domain-containing protein, partial [Acidimicrobiia bacterium]|nr:helix-turn-helix domain-containing protein [Acidimicrobiia bacterium]
DVDRPCTVGDVAAQFDLHANTVRPHLEQLRDAGLVRRDASPQGGVGRPQHRYTAVAAQIDVPRADEAHELLARMLAALCCRVKVDSELAVAVGRDLGSELADTSAGDPIDVFDLTMARLGFEPATDGDRATFTRCPFSELATEYPDLVCSLHRGLAEGVLASVGASLVEFHDIDNSEPCTAMVSA